MDAAVAGQDSSVLSNQSLSVAGSRHSTSSRTSRAKSSRKNEEENIPSSIKIPAHADAAAARVVNNHEKSSEDEPVSTAAPTPAAVVHVVREDHSIEAAVREANVAKAERAIASANAASHIREKIIAERKAADMQVALFRAGQAIEASNQAVDILSEHIQHLCNDAQNVYQESLQNAARVSELEQELDRQIQSTNIAKEQALAAEKQLEESLQNNEKDISELPNSELAVRGIDEISDHSALLQDWKDRALQAEKKLATATAEKDASINETNFRHSTRPAVDFSNQTSPLHLWKDRALQAEKLLTATTAERDALAAENTRLKASPAHFSPTPLDGGAAGEDVFSESRSRFTSTLPFQQDDLVREVADLPVRGASNIGNIRTGHMNDALQPLIARSPSTTSEPPRSKKNSAINMYKGGKPPPNPRPSKRPRKPPPSQPKRSRLTSSKGVAGKKSADKSTKISLPNFDEEDHDYSEEHAKLVLSPIKRSSTVRKLVFSEGEETESDDKSDGRLMVTQQGLRPLQEASVLPLAPQNGESDRPSHSQGMDRTVAGRKMRLRRPVSYNYDVPGRDVINDPIGILFQSTGDRQPIVVGSYASKTGEKQAGKSRSNSRR